MKLYTDMREKPLFKQDVQNLEDACKKAEPLTLSIPAGSEDQIFLLYEEERPVCAASFYFPDPGSCECVIFTHPDWRRKGFAGRMLEVVCEFLDQREEQSGPISLYLLADHKSPAALCCLEAWEAEYESSEYIMEHPAGSDCPDATNRSQELGPASGAAVEPDGQGLWRYHSNGQCLGTCRVELYHGWYYLHHVEILDASRNQGHGSRFLRLLLSALALPVRLQVSSRNLPALRLYKKTGFQITETLSRYYY